jgi:hypothetical protein
MVGTTRLKERRPPVLPPILWAAALAILGFGPSSGAAPEAATATDYVVLNAALSDLAASREPRLVTNRHKARTHIVLDVRTVEKSGMLSEDQLGAEFRNDPQRAIPKQMRQDLRRRNDTGGVSLMAFAPANRNIVPGELEKLRTSGRLSTAFERTFPAARAYVETWLPGYSADGRTAVLRFWIGPSAHGATGTYLLTRDGGKWKIRWRKFSFYA